MPVPFFKISAFILIPLLAANVVSAQSASSKPGSQWKEIPEASGETDLGDIDVKEKDASQSQSAKDATPETPGPVVIRGVTTKQVSGVVRLIRSTPETEVFFKDLKDSVIIPKDSHHNRHYDLCEQSRLKGTPVQLLIDPVSRRILGVPKAADKDNPLSSQ